MIRNFRLLRPLTLLWLRLPAPPADVTHMRKVTPPSDNRPSSRCHGVDRGVRDENSLQVPAVSGDQRQLSSGPRWHNSLDGLANAFDQGPLANDRSPAGIGTVPARNTPFQAPGH